MDMRYFYGLLCVFYRDFKNLKSMIEDHLILPNCFCSYTEIIDQSKKVDDGLEEVMNQYERMFLSKEESDNV